MRLLIGPMIALLALGACGHQGDGDSGGRPKCSDVWVPGKTLPASYDGCVKRDGSIVAPVTVTCRTGARFATYRDWYWARLGGTIGSGPSSAKAYADAYDACESP